MFEGLKRNQITSVKKTYLHNLMLWVIWLSHNSAMVDVRTGNPSMTFTKKNDGQATIQEIQDYLKKRGFQYERMQLFREVRDLITQGYVIPTKKGFYALTQKGGERVLFLNQTLDAERELFQGKGLDDVLIKFLMEPNQRQALTISLKTYDPDFIEFMKKELVKYDKDWDQKINDERGIGQPWKISPQSAELGHDIIVCLFATLRTRAIINSDKMKNDPELKQMLEKIIQKYPFFQGDSKEPE